MLYRILLYLGNIIFSSIITYFYGNIFTWKLLQFVFICNVESPKDMDCLGETVLAMIASGLLVFIFSVISITMGYAYLHRFFNKK